MSYLQRDYSAEVPSHEECLHRKHLKALVVKLAKHGLSTTATNFCVEMSKPEWAYATDYLMDLITKDNEYMRNLKGFMTKPFEAVNEHYGKDREKDRIEALEDLRFDIRHDRARNLTQIVAESGAMGREIHDSLEHDPHYSGRSYNWIEKDAFDRSEWLRPVGQVPYTFPLELSNAVEERGIPHTCDTMVAEFSRKVNTYLTDTAGTNSRDSVAFRGLWSTKDWPKYLERIRPELTENVRSIVSQVWADKTAKKLTSHGSLRNLSMDLETKMLEPKYTSIEDERGTVQERVNFDPDAIRYRLHSTDGFFDGVADPPSEVLSEFVDLNDPEFDRRTAKNREERKNEKRDWRKMRH